MVISEVFLTVSQFQTVLREHSERFQLHLVLLTYEMEKSHSLRDSYPKSDELMDTLFISLHMV